MIYTIINQKGGVSKTSICQHLGFSLIAKKKKVLFIDCDQQANLSSLLLAEKMDDDNSSFFDFFNGTVKNLKDIIIKTENFDLIQSNEFLATIKAETNPFLLKKALETIKNEYDFIIIDTPPSLGILTINALLSSDEILIPSDLTVLSLKGIRQLFNTITTLRESTKISLRVGGIILTRYKKRVKVNAHLEEVLHEVAKMNNTKVFKSYIRDSVLLHEAHVNFNTVFEHSPKSSIATDYHNLTTEITGVK